MFRLKAGMQWLRDDCRLIELCFVPPSVEHTLLGSVTLIQTAYSLAVYDTALLTHVGCQP